MRMWFAEGLMSFSEGHCLQKQAVRHLAKYVIVELPRGAINIWPFERIDLDQA